MNQDVADELVMMREDQRWYVGLQEDAVTRDDVEAWQLAFFQDRVRILSGMPQYYRT